MISKSLTFWTLLAGLAAFVLRWYFPTFPLDQFTILALILFFLGLFGVVPQLRMQGALTGSIVNSLAFWQLVAGFVAFVIHFFAPTFPFGEAVILAFFLFVLGFFGVHPELRARGLLGNAARSAVDGLTESRIVLYVLPDGPSQGQTRPAMVVRVWRTNGKPQPSGVCQLQVFTDESNDGLTAVEWRTSVLFDAGGGLGTWHWPEQA